MSRRNLIWMLIILSLAGLALFIAGRRPTPLANNDPAVGDLAPAIQAYKLIQAHGLNALSPEDACRGAVDGMARQIDEYSRHVSPEQAGRLQTGLAGTLVETGLRITEVDGRLMTLGSLPDSPAAKARIPAGRRILAIDDTDAEYLSLDDARELLQRPAAETVTVRLRDPAGREADRELAVAAFQSPTVTGIVRDERGEWETALDAADDIHYLHVSEFVTRRTAGEFHDAYRRLGRPKGLVLDLRDNPGGILQSAAVLADRFLDGGVIVCTVTREGQKYVHHAHPAGTYPPAELVVLVNGRTASAAEIAAGALKAHRRAVLVGRRTYGKFRGQTLIPLGGDMGSLYVTTAKYILGGPEPDTRPATTTRPDRPAGVEPDVDIRLTARARQRLRLLRLRAGLQPDPAPTSSTRPANAPLPHEQLKADILAVDAQLAEAIRLLKRRLAPKTRPAEGGPTEMDP